MKLFLSKRGLFILLLLSLGLQALAQVQRLDHTFYTSYFNTTTRIPVVVEFTLTKQMVSCAKEDKVPRKGFTADPLLPKATSLKSDYTGWAGVYDCGHNMCAEDNACDADGMAECFYYSNMFPQNYSLNRGVWKTLEAYERDYAVEYRSVKIYVGSYGKSATIGKDKVVVPKYCYKIIYFPDGSELSYIFPNRKPVSSDPEYYRSSVPEIEEETGIDFSRSRLRFSDN